MFLIDRVRMMDESDSSDTTGWATFIGIVICLCGNVIISFALNIQRLAHERIQRKAYREGRPHHHHQEPENYGTRPVANRKDDDDDDDYDEETQYLKSSLWWTGLVLMAIGETGNFVACKPCIRIWSLTW
jgi:magnesium transporter